MKRYLVSYRDGQCICLADDWQTAMKLVGFFHPAIVSCRIATHLEVRLSLEPS